MGLDSVELFIAFEKYFNIQFQHTDIESIRTIQDTTEIIAKYLNIEEEDLSLKDEIFTKVESVFRETAALNASITYSSLASIYLNENKTAWKRLRDKTGMKIPVPEKMSSPQRSFFQKAFISSWNPLYKWEEVTLEQFTEAVYAHNIDILVDTKRLKSKYEIYICVKAITSDCLGLELYEISPEKSYIDDLGVD